MNSFELKKQNLKLIRKSDAWVVADPCVVAKNIFQRTVGLLGKESIPQRAGLLILSCNSIHTFFMQFAIDVVYLSKDWEVVDINIGVKPWRAHLPRLGAQMTLEMMSGQISQIKKGDILCLS